MFNMDLLNNSILLLTNSAIVIAPVVVIRNISK